MHELGSRILGVALGERQKESADVWMPLLTSVDRSCTSSITSGVRSCEKDIGDVNMNEALE